MPKTIAFILIVLIFSAAHMEGIAQNVGIGTTSPDPKAALEVKSTDKGILFPRLTTAQRNAITAPPNGLHIFNTDERCLNFYDSAFGVWNCYCETDTCKVVTIRVAGGCNVDFYNTYGINYPGVKKFVLLIETGVTISCGTPSNGALRFESIPGSAPMTIRLINHGSILGAGGSGGTGSTGHPGSCYRNATAGQPGGHAITTRANVTIVVDNYGLIAGGGGGGGGGGGTTTGQYGGGGGGGAGTDPGIGGTGGGNTFSIIGSCGTTLSIAQNGTAGQTTTGGTGGTGPTGTGGNGGPRATVGQPGTGTFPGNGGAPGKAIAGNINNVINNIAGGQSLGVVD
jgi:hypothetical protein